MLYVLQCYNVTMLQCYSVTVLQCYSVYNVTVLQYVAKEWWQCIWRIVHLTRSALMVTWCELDPLLYCCNDDNNTDKQ